MLRVDYDFIVIGLGTAGSYAAWRLAEKGYSVLGIDKRTGPGSVHRSTGGIGAYWLKESKIMDDIPEDIVASPLLGFKMISPDSNVFHYRNEKNKIGVVFYQDKFEQFLSDRATKANAGLMWSSEVIDVIPLGDILHVNIRTKSGEICYHCNKLIIADGPNSPIGRKIGLAKPIKPIDMYHGGEFVFENNGKYPTDEFYIEFNSKYAPKGYTWYFPEGSYAKIGNGVPLAEGSSKRFLGKKVCDANLEKEFVKPIYEMAGLIPIAKPYKKVVSDDGKIAIIGDAARHVIAMTGGGIHLALVGGMKVAEFADDLQEYQNYFHKSGLYKLLKSAYYAKKLFNQFNDKDFNKMVKSIQGLELDHVMFDKPQRAMFLIIRRTFLRHPLLFLKCLKGLF